MTYLLVNYVYWNMYAVGMLELFTYLTLTNVMWLVSFGIGSRQMGDDFVHKMDRL